MTRSQKLLDLKQDQEGGDDLVGVERGQLIWNAVKLTGRGRLGDGLVLDGASFSCMMQCFRCDAQVLQTWTMLLVFGLAALAWRKYPMGARSTSRRKGICELYTVLGKL